MRICRRFWNDENFQIHYRESGQGETLVLIHEMPLSSEVFVPLMKSVGNALHLLAIDLPGYGDSDKPDSKLTIQDYANVLNNMLDDLNVQKFSVFGVHGGASIAIELAAKIPHRVENLILSGVPIFTEDERLKLNDNLVPLKFEDSGEHFKFWWENFSKKWDPTTPKKIIHNALIDIMKAGPEYENGYREAFDYNPLPAIEKLEQPIFLPISKADPLIQKNKIVLNLKNLAKEAVIDVPQHIAQLAPEETASLILKFIKK